MDDISKLPQAFRAVKKAIPVRVEFANADGVLSTLEGSVSYKRGDALLTGVEGEHWPVPLERFQTTYAPLHKDEAKGGLYVKRPSEVWAWVTDKTLDVPLPDGRGVLHANPGDILVQYVPGDVFVVAQRIFEATYERC